MSAQKLDRPKQIQPRLLTLLQVLLKLVVRVVQRDSNTPTHPSRCRCHCCLTIPATSTCHAQLYATAPVPVQTPPISAYASSSSHSKRLRLPAPRQCSRATRAALVELCSISNDSASCPVSRPLPPTSHVRHTRLHLRRLSLFAVAPPPAWQAAAVIIPRAPATSRFWPETKRHSRLQPFVLYYCIFSPRRDSSVRVPALLTRDGGCISPSTSPRHPRITNASVRACHVAALCISIQVDVAGYTCSEAERCSPKLQPRGP